MLFDGRLYVTNPYALERPQANDVARSILSFVDGTAPDATIEQLVVSLLGEFDVDEATLRSDVTAFLPDAIERGTLIAVELLSQESAALAEIRRLQETVPGLDRYAFDYCAVLGRDRLSPGCQACQRGRWAVFNVCPRCDRACFACPYTATGPDGRLRHRHGEHCGKPVDCNDCEFVSWGGNTYRSFRELKLQFDLLADQFDGIAWIGGEPLLPQVLERTLPLIRYFSQTYPDHHQWVYTNGIHAVPEALAALRAAGIREIRFNLAATRFSDAVLRAMAQARELFDWLCIEVPMTRDTHARLLERIDAVLATGLDQMNLAEWIVGSNHLDNPDLLEREGPLYCFRGYITSPVASRRYVYDVMRRAAEQGWPVVINDCGNEYKHYKLSIQNSKRLRTYRGGRGYWNAFFGPAEVLAWNDRLARGGAAG